MAERGEHNTLSQEKQCKTKRVVFIPLNSEEEKLSDNFKRLAKQDETTQHDLLLEAFQLLFKKHNLDLGGNPQRQLFSFVEGGVPKREAKHVCGFTGCKALAVGTGVFKNKTFWLCGPHLRMAREARGGWSDVRVPVVEAKQY